MSIPMIIADVTSADSITPKFSPRIANSIIVRFSLCEIVKYQLLSRYFLPAPLGDLLVDGMACDKAVNLDGMGLPATCKTRIRLKPQLTAPRDGVP